MKRDLFSRTHLRVWALYGCLAGVSLAHAGTVGASDFERLTTRTTGANTVAVTMGNPTGATNAVRIASTPSEMLAGTSGWKNHATWGSGTVSNGIRVGQSGYVNIAGAKVPVTVSTPITKAAMADGIGILFRNAAKLVGPLGVVLLLKDFADMLDAAGIRENPDAANDPDHPFLADAPAKWYDAVDSTFAHSAPTVAAACSASASWLDGVEPNFSHRVISQGDGSCYVEAWTKDGVPSKVYGTYRVVHSKDGSGGSVPANWEAVRPKFEEMSPLPSEVSQKVIDAARAQEGKNGIEPFKLTTGASTLTAPSSLPSTTKTDTKTSGNTTTTTTTTTQTGITTTGDQIKVSPTTTTTTTTRTTNPDGSVTENTTSETTTTETDEDPTTKPEAEPTPDLCEKNPEIIACQKMGEPPEPDELPKADKDITFTPVEFASSALCPAPLAVNWAFAGQTFAYEIAYTPLCNALADWVRPLLLLAAALFSVHVFTGGLKA